MIHSYQTHFSNGCIRLFAGLVLAASLAACGSHPRWNPSEAPRAKSDKAPVVIKTFFNEEKCPTSVDIEPDIDAKSGKRVEWHAYSGTGSSAKFDPEIEFAVYFDPFVDGRPITSKKGIATSSIINANTPGKYASGPEVIYKYTVLGKPERCRPKAFDPRIRILR